MHHCNIMYPSCDTIYTGVMLNVEITRTIFLFVCVCSPVPLSLVVVVSCKHLTIIVPRRKGRREKLTIPGAGVLCVSLSVSCARVRALTIVFKRKFDTRVHRTTTLYYTRSRKWHLYMEKNDVSTFRIKYSPSLRITNTSIQTDGRFS